MSFNPIHIWASMGMLSRFIALCLLGMAVSSVAVYVERIIAYARHRKATLAFAGVAHPAMAGHDFGAVLAAARTETKGSFLCRAIVPILEKYQGAKTGKGNLSPVEVARREAVRLRRPWRGLLGHLRGRERPELQRRTAMAANRPNTAGVRQVATADRGRPNGVSLREVSRENAGYRRVARLARAVQEVRLREPS